MEEAGQEVRPKDDKALLRLERRPRTRSSNSARMASTSSELYPSGPKVTPR